MPRKLTPKEARFVDEYLIDLNATQAAIRAGYSKRNAGKLGHQVLSRELVAKAIGVRMQKRAERVEIDQDWVLRKWIAVVQADESELMQWRIGPCEKCWKGKASYDKPNPACKDCHGEGVGRLVVSDTRTLSESARALFAGLQVSKEGIRVNVHSKEAALANIARHLGMFPTKVELSGPGGAPVHTMNANMNLEEFQKVAQQLLAKV